jgi:hypothetical protein
LALFFVIMSVFYVLYSIHAATRFDVERSTAGPSRTGGVGGKDVEGQVVAGGAAAAADHAADGQVAPRTSSILDKINDINSAPSGGAYALALGRRSAGITRLPPPTLD